MTIGRIHSFRCLDWNGIFPNNFFIIRWTNNDRIIACNIVIDVQRNIYSVLSGVDTYTASIDVIVYCQSLASFYKNKLLPMLIYCCMNRAYTESGMGRSSKRIPVTCNRFSTRRIICYFGDLHNIHIIIIIPINQSL